MALYVALFGGLGWILIPRLFNRVDHLPISQGLLATAAVVAMLFAWSAEVVGHVAMITGSFLAGILAGRARSHRRIEEGMSALAYGFFVPIFFVNIGLQVDIWALRGELVLLTALLTVVAVISKVLGSGAGALLGGFSRGESLRLGVGMISRGEVGLIVAQLLVINRVVSPDLISIAVIMVLVTTLVTPILLRVVFARKPAAPTPEASTVE